MSFRESARGTGPASAPSSDRGSFSPGQVIRPSPRIPPSQHVSIQEAPGGHLNGHDAVGAPEESGCFKAGSRPCTGRSRTAAIQPSSESPARAHSYRSRSVDDVLRQPSASATIILPLPKKPRSRPLAGSDLSTKDLWHPAARLRSASGPPPAVTIATIQLFQPPPGFFGGGASLGERRGRSREACHTHTRQSSQTLSGSRFRTDRGKHHRPPHFTSRTGAARFARHTMQVGLTEAGVNPARPRHCKRPGTTPVRLRSQPRPLGITPGKAERQPPRARRRGPPAPAKL
jgi:hypothetical protein